MSMPTRRASQQPAPTTGDEGYLLLGLVVTCFLLLLLLAVAAPRVAKQLERDREVESEHRAQEYVRAIQLYYRRTKRFPVSVEELLGTGTASGTSSALKFKYLRQQYKDPLTGGDYRLVLVGKAKTEVKGFFGEPLEGMPVGNLGSASGMQSTPGFGGAAQAGGPGSATAGGSGFSLGNNVSNTAQLVQAMGGTPAAAGAGGTSSAAASTGSSFGSGTDASSFQGSKGAFLGVASNAKGHGLVEWNGSENIEDWEFLYDPRVELLKAKVSLFGGTPAAGGSGSLGSGVQSSGSGFFGSSSSPGSGASGTQSGFGFGSSSPQTQGNATSGTSSPSGFGTPSR